MLELEIQWWGVDGGRMNPDMVLSFWSLQRSWGERHWTDEDTNKYNFISFRITLRERGYRAQRVYLRDLSYHGHVSRKWWLNCVLMWGVNWLKKGGEKILSRGGSMYKAELERAWSTSGVSGGLVGEHGEGAGERDARGLQGRQGSDLMRSL